MGSKGGACFRCVGKELSLILFENRVGTQQVFIFTLK